MYIADEDIAFVGLSVATAGCHDMSVVLNEFLHLRPAEDGASVMGDVVSEGAHDHVAVTLQSPTALDVTALSMCEGEEWQ